MDDQVAQVVKLIAQQPVAPADGDGVVGNLKRLCAAATGALSVSGVGMSVMAEDGVRGVAAASDAASERIEELQFVLGEGPCIDAFAARRPVLVPDLADGVVNHWPVYTSTVLQGGVRAVFAFPLQVGAARLGVLDVFRAHPGSLSDDELRQALTFADVAVTTLLDGQENAYPGTAADGLDEAIGRGAELFQAQGMIMVQLGVNLAEALARIRAHAYAEDRNLHEAARDIVERKLRFYPDHP
jgi:hypothetical protein